MPTTLNAVAVTKNLKELEVSERVIRDYILGLDECDALRFTYTPNSSIHYTPCVCEDGEYVEANYAPSYFDADEFHTSTLVAALVEVAAANGNEGLIAVNADDDTNVLIYNEA